MCRGTKSEKVLPLWREQQHSSHSCSELEFRRAGSLWVSESHGSGEAGQRMKRSQVHRYSGTQGLSIIWIVPHGGGAGG